MTETEFNPEARDGDGDGIIQEGTEFERPIEEADVNPVEDVVEDVVEETEVAEPVIEEVVELPVEEAVVEEVAPVVIKPIKKKAKKPALNHSESGALVSGSTEVSTPAEKTATSSAEKVAIHSTKNVYWEGVGRVLRGYNIVSKDAADKWLQRTHIRLASPEEVKSL